MPRLTAPQWACVLPEDARAAALRTVAALVGRPGTAPRAVPPDLAAGGAGLALAFHQLDRCLPGQGWDVPAGGYLAAALRGAGRPGAVRTAGLYRGLGGLAFAARTVAADEGVLAVLDRGIEDAATAGARGLGGGTHGVAARVFDVISGLTGTGAYLLCRAAEPGAAAALSDVLGALVALCGERAGVPHWHTPAAALSGDALPRLYPGGALNCGFSHGIAGPLALLALALGAGVSVPGQREAVEWAAGWLLAQRADDGFGPDWPRLVALPDRSATPAADSSWCYGSPGIARSLWLAGVALDDRSLRDVAAGTVTAALRRPLARHRTHPEAGLCHGVAGLLQITLRFAHDTGDPFFATAAVELTGQLVELAGPNRLRDPGFLTGAAGTALALLAAATSVPPTWDRMLLLA